MSVRAALNEVSVTLGSTRALNEVHLEVQPGQFLALLGPSGSGKTTALNVMAGFVRPNTGSVTFDGVDVSMMPPAQRDIGIVFQGYALFPHMTVAENVAFPLRMRRVDKTTRDRKTREALALVGLNEHARRSVTTLSGGQRQRVALARAIVFEPKILLLDEPLAALDKQLRDTMQLEIKRLQRRLDITTIAVTHDQVEALTMADIVAVMRGGYVEQVATPQEIYLRPKTLFVATFLGETNLVPVKDGSLLGFGQLPTNRSGQAVLRPEQLVAAKSTTSDGPPKLGAKATVEEVAFQGERLRTRVRLCSNPEIELTLAQQTHSSGEVAMAGSTVEVTLTANSVHIVEETYDSGIRRE